jgi:hypothetical protein
MVDALRQFDADGHYSGTAPFVPAIATEPSLARITQPNSATLGMLVESKG